MADLSGDFLGELVNLAAVFEKKAAAPAPAIAPEQQWSYKGNPVHLLKPEQMEDAGPLAQIYYEDPDNPMWVKKVDLRQGTKYQQRKQQIHEKGLEAEPTGTWDSFAEYLLSRGYSLTLDIDPSQHDEFQDMYAEWTGGEDIDETDCVRERPKSTIIGGWRLKWRQTADLPKYAPADVPIRKASFAGHSATPQILTNGRWAKLDHTTAVGELVKRGLRLQKDNQIPLDDRMDREEEKAMAQHASLNTMATIHKSKQSCDHCGCEPEEAMLPAAVQVHGDAAKQLPLAPGEENEPETEKEAGFNFFFPGQVTKEFYPELMHDVIDYPNSGAGNLENAPMITPEIVGDEHEVPNGIELAIEASLDDRKMAYYSSNYVSTSPAGAMGIGRDGKPEVLDGAPLRKENDIRGGMFMDEFHQQYEGVPGAALAVVSKKVAAKDELHQFEVFLKKVVGEIAATFVAAFKVTNRPILNQVPGIGEVQLAQVEQPSSLSSFNIVNTGSRVKYLLDKLNDGDIREAVNKARAQAAVWLDDPAGGFVYEVFVRAESIDTDSMIMKYTFITGTKDSEA